MLRALGLHEGLVTFQADSWFLPRKDTTNTAFQYKGVPPFSLGLIIYILINDLKDNFSMIISKLHNTKRNYLLDLYLH